MTTITRTISDWAAGVQYEDLPTEVIHEAKRFLMDSVGCALGGAQQHDVHIARDVLSETAGSGDCPLDCVDGHCAPPAPCADDADCGGCYRCTAAGRCAHRGLSEGGG